MSAKNDDVDANSSQDIVRETPTQRGIFDAKIFAQYRRLSQKMPTRRNPNMIRDVQKTSAAKMELKIAKKCHRTKLLSAI